jgi:hypothetical protein
VPPPTTFSFDIVANKKSLCINTLNCFELQFGDFKNSSGECFYDWISAVSSTAQC